MPVRLCFLAVRPPRSFVRPDMQVLLPRYLMNALNNFDKTDEEYSLVPTDDLILEVKDQRSTSQ